MSTWMIYREDKQTGIRFFLGRIEAQEPLAALRLAAQFYECDPEELVVRTFLPEAACNPLLPWLLFLAVLQKLMREHDGREASLPVQLRRPLQTG